MTACNIPDPPTNACHVGTWKHLSAKPMIGSYPEPIIGWHLPAATTCRNLSGQPPPEQSPSLEPPVNGGQQRSTVGSGRVTTGFGSGRVATWTTQRGPRGT
ncbi:hypothetical protein Tco_1324019 [Tanacetum coccineum]